MEDEKYVDVHFTRPPFGPFTYAVDGEAAPSPGCRLEVELGKRAAVGLAGRPAPRPSPSVKVKKITRIIDYEPILPPFIWELLECVSRRYAASPGEAARLALPISLDFKRDDVLVLTAEFAASPALEGLGEDERRLVGEIWEAGWLGARAAGLGEAVRGLHDKNIIAVEPYATTPALDDLLVYAAATPAKRLGKVGQAVVAALAEGPQPAKRYLREPKKRDALRRLLRRRQVALGLVSNGPSAAPPRAGATLVTGGDAGRRLEEALAAARDAGAQSVLVLVPEMYRVPAVRRRCEDYWGNSFEPYYSDMSPGARWRAFVRCRRRTATRVVGSRSALFLPLPPEAAVVITDEADGAYKQWEMPPYYHARDVAAARAASAALVMAAAAPSLEAYARVSSGDAAIRPLAEAGRKPELTIVDMAKVVAAEGPVILSAALVRGLQETLAAAKRALVVVNRRGYIPHIYCDACGRSLTCGRCDVAFTYHKEERVLRCHYCMRREPMPRRCPYCGKEKLTGVGFGTEKLAAEVELLFGSARVGRADSDALPTPARARSFWEDFAAGAYDVVVGTQMALRALDDEVALAALASADTAMNLPDFRASEQTFRTLRRMLEPSSRRRRVLIQTFYPDHYAVAAAAAGDYEAFAKQELAFRRRLNLPPFTHLVNVVVAEREEAGGERKASEVATRLEGIFGSRADILGPVPAPVARSRGRRRWQILIKTDLREIENAGAELAALASRKGPARVRVDVDPYELF